MPIEQPEVKPLPIMPTPAAGPGDVPSEQELEQQADEAAKVEESELKGVEDIQNQIFEKRYSKLVKAITKK